MIQHILLSLLPLFGGPSSELSPAKLGGASVAPVADLEALLEEFERAEQAHIEALKQVEDRKQRAALRKQHPAFEFYPRFAELAAAGEGEAYLWLIPNARYCGKKKSEERELQASQVRELFGRHCGEPWFEEAIPLANKARKALGEEAHGALLRSVIECSERMEKIGKRVRSDGRDVDRLMPGCDRRRHAARTLIVIERIGERRCYFLPIAEREERFDAPAEVA